MLHEAKAIKARINEIRNEKSLKQSDFANSIGLSQSGYATLLARDGTSQRLKTLALAVETVYGIRHEWILCGDGPKQKGTQKHLGPLQRIQLKVLSAAGIAPELKSEAFRMMVTNSADGILLGLMMQSLATSRNIKDRGAPTDLLDRMENDRLQANELLNQFDRAFEKICQKLSPDEQMVMVCAVFDELKEMKVNPLESLKDKDSRSRVEMELTGLVEKIDQIRKLTKSNVDVEKWLKQPILDENRTIPEPAPGWKREIYSGDKK